MKIRAIQCVLAVIVLVLPRLAMADELAGTWRGTLTRDGETFEVEFNFSDAGYFVTEYTNNQGVTRSVELSEAGQRFQYVPEGGGVTTVELVAIEKTAGALAFVLRTSFERASGGYLEQNFVEELLRFELTGDGLVTELQSQSNTHFGDAEMTVGGGDVSVARGILRRAN
jgi:hypothetical protein